ncbi:hypothetical protein FDP41_007867 [Naegleria fowleri]|uniref:Uncharacterized protein n=1 Tax=Naegleria fowleri TaxID=5763 RepID=A0A6A5CAE1_NAEFO|nr:uncharacterized protein FDP41_007867 [Naegleria fowleri]KAF0983952.1 hypothetical protein FDP41_007867 [Naegleria fowleri]CAG4718803.1 unnamed protein product [Naegleria fowleri]
MNENSTSSSSITTFSSPNTTLPSEQSQNNVNALKSSISDLAFGFESIFRPEFDSVCSHLQELIRSQQVIGDLLKEGNTAMASIPQMKEIQEVLSHMPSYINKLHFIKQEMHQIQDKTHKMKIRSDKLLK